MPREDGLMQTKGTCTSVSISILLLLIIVCGCSSGSTYYRGVEVESGTSLVDLIKLNTLVKEFLLMPDGDPPVDLFEGWEITTHCRAVRVKDLVGVDTFRVTIETEYKPAVTNLEQAGRVNLVTIDSLKLHIPYNDSIIVPVQYANGVNEVIENPQIQYRHLMGPRFRYEQVRIPDAYGELRLSYVATLLDRETGAAMSSRRFEHLLHRFEDKIFHPLWYSPKHDSVEVEEPAGLYD